MLTRSRARVLLVALFVTSILFVAFWREDDIIADTDDTRERLARPSRPFSGKWRGWREWGNKENKPFGMSSDEDNPTARLRNQAHKLLIQPHMPLVPTEGETSHQYQFGQGATGYRWYTESRLRHLAACTARNDCPPNAHKVIIVQTVHCNKAIFSGYRGGEGIWCLGMIDSLQRQGYTVLLAGTDIEYVYHIYRQIPDLVKVVMGQPTGNHAGNDEEQSYQDYLKSESRPDGIPAWKYFISYYFPNPFNSVVGNPWLIAAEPRVGPENFTFLGYSIEPASSSEVVPFEERPHRVWVMGKYTWFFYESEFSLLVYDDDFYVRATEHFRKKWPDFEFVGAIRDGRGDDEIEASGGPQKPPPGIRNLEKLNSTQFDYELTHSRVLLGVGRPGLSPSPWRALARGVPFVQPTWKENGNQFWQHNTFMKYLEEPQSYIVKSHNYEDFIEKLDRALSTPVKPYIPEWMTREAHDKRMRDFVERDWRSLAAEILEERKKGNETQLCIIDYAGECGLFEL